MDAASINADNDKGNSKSVGPSSANVGPDVGNKTTENVVEEPPEKDDEGATSTSVPADSTTQDTGTTGENMAVLGTVIDDTPRHSFATNPFLQEDRELARSLAATTSDPERPHMKDTVAEKPPFTTMPSETSSAGTMSSISRTVSTNIDDEFEEVDDTEERNAYLTPTFDAQ